MRFAAAAAVWIVALAFVAPFVLGPWKPPEAITDLARRLDDQMLVTFVVSGVIFLLSQFALGYAVLRFGRKPQRAGDATSPAQTAGRCSGPSAAGVLHRTLAGQLFGLGGSRALTAARHRVRRPRPAHHRGRWPAVRLEFRYTGPDGDFGPTDPKFIDDSSATRWASTERIRWARTTIVAPPGRARGPRSRDLC